VEDKLVLNASRESPSGAAARIVQQASVPFKLFFGKAAARLRISWHADRICALCLIDSAWATQVVGMRDYE
jgi:hypothetical protein